MLLLLNVIDCAYALLLEEHADFIRRVGRLNRFHQVNRYFLFKYISILTMVLCRSHCLGVLQVFGLSE